MDVVLSDTEARVLGCLIEKEMATPDYYPLTLNALVAACNQKSNRKPVMALTEKDVLQALDAMRYEHKLAMQVTSTASRVPKYRHNLQSRWEFSPAERAVLCELLVRGPQTIGELRTHGARLHPLADTAEVEATLSSLNEFEIGPLAIELPREAGRRERRWSHLLCGEPDLDAIACEPTPEPARVALQEENDRIARLEGTVAALQRDLADLREQFATFKQQFE